MAKQFDVLNADHLEFIKKQKMFFVASAPLDAAGRVNISPKGYDSIHIVDQSTLQWVDLGGSGVESLAHARENGRMTIMFCAFEGAALILRLYGQAQAITFDDPGFDDALKNFAGIERARAVFTLNITRVQESCGWGVPFYDFAKERDQLHRAHAHHSLDEWKEHRRASNQKSIDGLPGLLAE